MCLRASTVGGREEVAPAVARLLASLPEILGHLSALRGVVTCCCLLRLVSFGAWSRRKWRLVRYCRIGRWPGLALMSRTASQSPSGMAFGLRAVRGVVAGLWDGGVVRGIPAGLGCDVAAHADASLGLWLDAQPLTSAALCPIARTGGVRCRTRSSPAASGVLARPRHILLERVARPALWRGGRDRSLLPGAQLPPYDSPTLLVMKFARSGTQGRA